MKVFMLALQNQFRFYCRTKDNVVLKCSLILFPIRILNCMLKTIQVFAFAIAEFSLHIEMNNAERKSVRPFLVAKFSDIRKPKAIILEELLNIN